MKDMTLDELEKYIIEIGEDRKPKKDRNVLVVRGCDYRGRVTEDSSVFEHTHCGNEDCKGCNNWYKQMNEGVKEWAKNYSPPTDGDFILPEKAMVGKFKIGDKVCNHPEGGSNKTFVEGKVVRGPIPYGTDDTHLWEYEVRGPGPGGRVWIEYEYNLIFVDKKRNNG